MFKNWRRKTRNISNVTVVISIYNCPSAPIPKHTLRYIRWLLPSSRETTQVEKVLVDAGDINRVKPLSKYVYGKKTVSYRTVVLYWPVILYCTVVVYVPVVLYWPVVLNCPVVSNNAAVPNSGKMQGSTLQFRVFLKPISHLKNYTKQKWRERKMIKARFSKGGARWCSG